MTALDEALPRELRGPGTTITKVAAGLSGAGVYRVDADGAAYILKVAGDADSIEAWRRRLHVQQLVAGAGLAPRIVHVDEARRAMVTEFVADRGFPMYYYAPPTHDEALVSLGSMLRRVHDLPLPPDTVVSDGMEFLASTWAKVDPAQVPRFVEQAVRRVLDDTPPAHDRGLVLSHNDPNPSNLIYDGERVMLLDWDTAGANDPWFDLAVVALFLRMDEPTTLTLLAAYEGSAVSSVPPRLTWNRRLAATMCGAAAMAGGAPAGLGATARDLPVESTPGLFDFYQQMRAGAVSLATAEGRWAFGLALVKEGLAI